MPSQHTDAQRNQGANANSSAGNAQQPPPRYARQNAVDPTIQLPGFTTIDLNRTIGRGKPAAGRYNRSACGAGDGEVAKRNATEGRAQASGASEPKLQRIEEKEEDADEIDWSDYVAFCPETANKVIKFPNGYCFADYVFNNQIPASFKSISDLPYEPFRVPVSLFLEACDNPRLDIASRIWAANPNLRKQPSSPSPNAPIDPRLATHPKPIPLVGRDPWSSGF